MARRSRPIDSTMCIMTQLRVVSAGPGVTLQDAGRRGYLRFGVTAAGPMDPLAFATANGGVEAQPGATAIEVSLGGVELAADAPLSLAIAGGEFRVEVDRRPLPAAALVALDTGQKLTVRAGDTGAWCYVAVAGSIAVPRVLGSTATHTRSALGGIAGRALKAGDMLPTAQPRVLEPRLATLDAPWLARRGTAIRVVLGPQDDFFDKDEIGRFLAGPWTITPRSDRMAYLLDGPALTHCKGYNIVSDGIAFGAIQVPGDGKPVVLMADRQPTGGYPKIANVIGADLGKLAQLRPGTHISFSAVTIEEAVAALRAQADNTGRPIRREPLIRKEFSSEFLLGMNLVGGVTANGSGE